jgi:hypothetical protein
LISREPTGPTDAVGQSIASLREGKVQLFEATLRINLRHRVDIDRALQFRYHVDRIDRLRGRGQSQGVLVQNVAGHGHYIRFRISDRLVALDTQQTQEHFLHEIGYVRGISKARSQVAPQPPVMLGRNFGDKGLFFVCGQISAFKHLGLVPLERLRTKNGYQIPEVFSKSFDNQ